MSWYVTDLLTFGMGPIAVTSTFVAVRCMSVSLSLSPPPSLSPSLLPSLLPPPSLSLSFQLNTLTALVPQTRRTSLLVRRCFSFPTRMASKISVSSH